jgi:hypothetical protein
LPLELVVLEPEPELELPVVLVLDEPALELLLAWPELELELDARPELELDAWPLLDAPLVLDVVLVLLAAPPPPVAAALPPEPPEPVVPLERLCVAAEHAAPVIDASSETRRIEWPFLTRAASTLPRAAAIGARCGGISGVGRNAVDDVVRRATTSRENNVVDFLARDGARAHARVVEWPFLDAAPSDIAARVTAVASGAAGAPVAVRVGDEAFGYRNVGVTLPRARRSALEARNLRRRVMLALERLGVTSAEAALAPRVVGDLVGSVRVCATPPPASLDASALARVARPKI